MYFYIDISFLMGYNLITVIVTIFIYKRYYNHIKILEKEKNTWLNFIVQKTEQYY